MTQTNSDSITPSKKNGIKLLSDEAISDENIRDDGLGFENYSIALSNVILGTKGPFTIGVFGEWGTGKTSLMKMIEKQVSSNSEHLTIWFNAWMYEKEEHPLIPLVIQIINKLEENKEFLTKLGESSKKIATSLRAIAYSLSTSTKVKIPGLLETNMNFSAKDAIDKEKELTQHHLDGQSFYHEIFESLNEIRLKGDTRLIIFIDDLDRCFPDNAIKLLESIKLVLSQLGFTFVIGVARYVIEGYLDHKYHKEFGVSELNGQKYLDKIIQLSFNIPPHHSRLSNLCKSLLENLDEDHKNDLAPMVNIIEIACTGNPRDMVRFINNIILDKEISSITNISIPYGFFVVTRSLQYRWEKEYNALISNPNICRLLAKYLEHIELENNKIDYRAPKYLEEIAVSYTGKREDLNSIFESITYDDDFFDTINSDIGRTWLERLPTRRMVIEFLEDTRNEASSRGKIRVYEIAKRIGIGSKELADFAIKNGFPIKGHSSTLDPETANKLEQLYCFGQSSNKPEDLSIDIKQLLTTTAETVLEDRYIQNRE